MKNKLYIVLLLLLIGNVVGMAQEPCYEYVSHAYQIKKGDSIKIREIWYKDAGIFQDTIIHIAPDTCDTVETVSIDFIKRYDFYETKRFCGDTAFYWHDIYVDEAKEYIKTYVTPDGLDSAYHLQVFFEDSVRHYYETRYGCKSKLPYIWNGLRLFEECDTVREMKTQQGCDSIVHLTLYLLNNPPHTKTTTYFCPAEGIFTHGIQVRTERTFSDTLTSYCGCDSIVDSLFTPYPQSFFHTEFQQHYQGEPYLWSVTGKTYTTDGYYYDTLPEPSMYGCDSIYELHLVTKYDIYTTINLCQGDTIGYSSKTGRIIVDKESHFVDSLKTIFGGDSVIHDDFYFTTKKVIEVDPITICGNETYEWIYDETHRKIIDGKNYCNQKSAKTYTEEIKLGQCQVARMQVTVVPYYITDSLVVRCNDEMNVPFIYTDHTGKQYTFDKPNTDKTIMDTLNAPIFHEPGQPIKVGQCANIRRFRFVSTSKCTDDTYYLCEGDKIKIDQKWYNKVGEYRNLLSDNTVHRFEIIAVPDPIVLDKDTCISHTQLPFIYHDLRISTRNNTITTIDTLAHIKYAQQNCDYAIVNLHLTIYPNDTAEVQTYSFCSNETINVKTRTGKVLTKAGYYEDLLTDWRCKFENGDSIFPYYIYVHQAYNFTVRDSLKRGEVYRWTFQGKDSLLTVPGNYVDTNRTITGCDSIYTLVLNWNDPYFEYDSLIGCSNELPFVWHGKNFYNDTVLVDTIFNPAKDSIFALNLHIAPAYDSLRYIALLPEKTYNFYGHELTLDDTCKTFKNTLPTVMGCDSVERVIIVPVNPVYKDTILCPNQYIIIDGDTVQETYNDTSEVQGSWGLTIYTVLRKPEIIYEQQKQITKGSSYLWTTCKGTVSLSQAGTYLDTCINQYGCDSIIRLKIVIVEPQFQTDTVELCYRDLPYLWHGQEYYTSGTYVYNDKTPLGQNYSDTLHFIVVPAIEQNILIDTCDLGFPVRINGKDYHKECAFTDTLTSVVTHCDSIVHYVLKFHTQVKIFESKQITEGSTYLWRGQECRVDSQYTDIGLATDGCDTLFTLFLKVCPPMPVLTRTIDACRGEYVLVNGDTIRDSQNVDEYHYTENGCEYLSKVNVVFHDPFYKITVDSIYPGGTYPWRDKQYTSQGVYYDSLTTVEWGCDSIYKLSLSYSQLTYTSNKKIVCRDSVPYQHKGYGTYFNDTTFIDTTLNERGWPCHIHYWQYTISDFCSDYDTHYLCPGEGKIIDGLYVDTIGFYSVHHQTSELKDSLYRFKVLPGTTYEKVIERSGCDSIIYSGYKFLYHGSDEPFEQTLTHKSMYGCDSIEHLILTIHSSKHQTRYAMCADYELPYIYAGQEFTESGIYPIKFYTQYGCDSIVDLNLKVKQTLNDTSYMSYCKGDPEGVTIFGKTYWPTTRLVIDSIFPEGDNPVRHTVIVNVNQPFTITQFHDQADQYVCAANKLTFYVNYEVNNPSAAALPTQYDVDFFVGNLDVAPMHASYLVKGKTTIPIEMDGLGTSVEPGYYSYRISFYSAGCSTSDTSFIGNVLVRYPADVMEANWHDVVALVNENFNEGHWVFEPPYAWQVWNAVGEDKTHLVAPTDSKQPYIVSNNLRENDQVVATLYRTGYDRPVPSCPFTFVPVAYTSTYQPILIYPTSVALRNIVHVQTNDEGTYVLYDPTGNKYHQGNLSEGDNTVAISGMAGCYLMHVTLQDGSYKLQKLIVHE